MKVLILSAVLIAAGFGASAQEAPPASGEDVPTEGTPSASPKDPRASARDAAAQTAGGVIGFQLGLEAVKKMRADERRDFLEMQKRALRGELLRRYAFDRSGAASRLGGSVVVLREGRDAEGRSCRELEVDLILEATRYDERQIVCQSQDGSWLAAREADVRFHDDTRGPGRPTMPGDGGGWLPLKNLERGVPFD